MVQALGVLVNVLSSIKSVRKLLEGFDTRNGQALLSSVSPFQVRSQPKAGLVGVAEEVKAIKEGVGELAQCSLSALCSSLPSPSFFLLSLPSLLLRSLFQFGRVTCPGFLSRVKVVYTLLPDPPQNSSDSQTELWGVMVL